MKAYLRNGDLSFRRSGFHGGRNNADGSGVVEITLNHNEGDGDIELSLFDNMSNEDGHYSPVTLSAKNTETLIAWLSDRLAKIKGERRTFIATEDDGSQWVSLEDHLAALAAAKAGRDA